MNLSDQAEKKVFYLILTLITAFFCTIAIYTDGTGGNGDSICHYMIARGAWNNPVLYFDHWGKPLYTLLCAPFAHMGFKVVKCFNVVVSCLACALTYHTAKRLQLNHSLWVLVFYFFGSEFYEVTFTAFTEPVFALVFATGVYLLVIDRFTSGTLTLSFLPFARSEGLVILCVLLVYLIYLQKFKLLPLLLTGHLVYALSGAFVYHDLLWVFNRIPYATLKSVYGHGNWNHFVVALYYMIGPITYLLMGIGILISLFPFIHPARAFRDRQVMKKLFLCTGMFVAFLFAHSMFWALGIFGSLGLTRVFIGIIPAICLLALMGLSPIVSLANRVRLTFILNMFVISASAYFTFFYTPTSMSIKDDLYLNEGQQYMAYQVAPYINRKFPSHQAYVSDIGIAFLIDQNYYDSTANSINVLHPLYALKENEMIIWDDLFSKTFENIALDTLMHKSYLKHDTSFIQPLTNGDTLHFSIFCKR